MNRVAKWSAIVLVGLIVLVLLAGATVYAASEVVLRRSYDVPLEEIAVPTDTAAIAEGRRLAIIRGCYDGCHGPGFEGQVFWDEPWIARLVAPNLTQVAAQHTDAELERIIRDGVRPDGTSTWGMPSASFYHLSDQDVGSIIAFLRSVPVSDGPATEVQIRMLARLGVLAGEFPPQAQTIEHGAARFGEQPRSDTVAFGQYLAATICTECHGLDLQGGQGGGTPTAFMAAAYSEEEFTRLMRTGIALGDRELDLMKEVAQGRFSHMTDDELHALHTYLKERASSGPGISLEVEAGDE